MKRIFLVGAVGVSLILLLWSGTVFCESKWVGVDEAVVEKFAMEANRPPRAPWIDTDQGDLLLFVFLLAGVVGGFVGGYYFRELFPPKIGKEI
jgi:hypothetical protein